MEVTDEELVRTSQRLKKVLMFFSSMQLMSNFFHPLWSMWRLIYYYEIVFGPVNLILQRSPVFWIWNGMRINCINVDTEKWE